MPKSSGAGVAECDDPKPTVSLGVAVVAYVVSGVYGNAGFETMGGSGIDILFAALFRYSWGIVLVRVGGAMGGSVL